LRDAHELVALALAGLLPNLAYLSLGAWLLRACGAPVRGSERVAVAYLAGTGVASLLLLGTLTLGGPLPLAACAAIALAGVPLLRMPRAPRFADAAVLALAALTFLAALGPETNWDGFEYHLPIVTAWTQGGVRALPGWLDAELRAGIDLLFAPAVAAGQPDAAACVSACFAAALAALLRAEASRRATPLTGSLCAGFALAVPLCVQNAAYSTVDLGVGAYGFLALLEADRWSRSRDGRHLLASAAFAAFAANGKLHAAALVPAVLAVAWLGGARPSVVQLARAAALFAALAAPWFAKEWATTGNPLFPLFASALGSGPFDPRHLELRQLRLGTDYPVPRDAAGFVTYLVGLTFGRNVYSGGLVGPLPLALGVLAIGRTTRATAALAGVVAAGFALQAVFLPALRFALPLVPFLGLAAAVGGARLARSGGAARAALALSLSALALLHGTRLLAEYLPRVAALRDPHAYELAIFPDQDALRRIVAQAEPAVAIPMGAVAWMDRPVYLLHWERNGELFFDAVRGNWTPPADALALLRRRGVRSLVIDVPAGASPERGLGHATLDAWLSKGEARVRDDVPRLPARRGREWLLVELR
jgi:hypothetical protein